MGFINISSDQARNILNQKNDLVGHNTIEVDGEHRKAVVVNRPIIEGILGSSSHPMQKEACEKALNANDIPARHDDGMDAFVIDEGALEAAASKSENRQTQLG